MEPCEGPFLTRGMLVALVATLLWVLALESKVLAPEELLSLKSRSRIVKYEQETGKFNLRF